jgi:hypothetical protein
MFLKKKKKRFCYLKFKNNFKRSNIEALSGDTDPI